MKMPMHPIKPVEPKKPKEFFKTFNKISFDEKEYSLEELLGLFPKEVKKEDIVFFGEYDYGNEYGDGCGYHLTPAYFVINKNKKYESELKKYNKNLVKFQKELKNYEAKLAIYNLELTQYNEWVASEQHNKIEDELKKALKTVERLKKKLNK